MKASRVFLISQLDVEWSPQIRIDLNLETRKMP